MSSFRKPEVINMYVLRVFFDPHPSFTVAVPIPTKIKKVADELSGETLSLTEAVARLRAQAGTGTIEVVSQKNYISLHVVDGEGCEHDFLIIKYF